MKVSLFEISYYYYIVSNFFTIFKFSEIHLYINIFIHAAQVWTHFLDFLWSAVRVFFSWIASRRAELQSCFTAPHWSNRSIAGSYIRSYEIKQLLDNKNICRQFGDHVTLRLRCTRSLSLCWLSQIFYNPVSKFLTTLHRIHHEYFNSQRRSEKRDWAIANKENIQRFHHLQRGYRRCCR